MGSGAWGLGFGVWSLGFGVWGLGFGVRGLGFEFWGLGCGIWGLGFGVWGLEFWVWALMLRVQGSRSRSHSTHGTLLIAEENQSCLEANVYHASKLTNIDHGSQIEILMIHKLNPRKFTTHNDLYW